MSALLKTDIGVGRRQVRYGPGAEATNVTACLAAKKQSYFLEEARHR